MRDWKKIPIGDVVEHPKTWNPLRSTSDEVFNYIDLSAVDQDSKLIIGAREVSCKEAPSRARQLVTKGDIIVSTVRPNLNSVAQVPEYLDGATASTGFCILRPRPSLLDGRFLFHWIKSPIFITDMVKKATGANYPAVSDRIILESILPLPSLQEQERIADILDRAEALRAKRRAALAQLDELTEVIFMDMFGNPTTNPKRWKSVSMPDAVVGKYGIKAGPFGSSLKKEEYTTSGYRIYGQEQVIAGRFDIGDYYISERKYQQLKACAVNEGDLLVSLVGSFGKVLVVPRGIEPGIINPRLLKITPNKNLLTSYFLAALLSLPTIQAEFGRMAHGGTMGILNAGLLKQLQVILPPLDLQREFSRRIAVVEKLKTAHKASLAELDDLFASLQYRAFRGEI